MKAIKDTQARLKAARVPGKLASRLATLPRWRAPATSSSLPTVPAAQSATRRRRSCDRRAVRLRPRGCDDRRDRAGDYYESLALQKARDSLETAHRDLARNILTKGNGAAFWEGAEGDRLAATASQVDQLLSDRRPSLAKVTVAASLLSELARA
jgi:hypothetical protein